MQYALAHSDHIHKLILSNSMPASSEDLALFIKEREARLKPYQTKLTELYANPGFKEGDPTIIEEHHRIVARAFCYNPEKAALLSLYMDQQACVNSAKIYALLNKNELDKSFDLRPKLERLNMEIAIPSLPLRLKIFTKVFRIQNTFL